MGRPFLLIALRKSGHISLKIFLRDWPGCGDYRQETNMLKPLNRSAGSYSISFISFTSCFVVSSMSSAISCMAQLGSKGTISYCLFSRSVNTKLFLLASMVMMQSSKGAEFCNHSRSVSSSGFPGRPLNESLCHH